MPLPNEHAAALSALRADPTLDAMTKVERLRSALERAARATLGAPTEGDLVAALRANLERGATKADVRAAEDLLAEATTLQWQIGSWSSGPGEGLHSMFEVRRLQLARAWLLAAGGEAERELSRDLVAEIEGDPNRIADRLAKHVAALRERLGR